jgi:hypothetical protein
VIDYLVRLLAKSESRGEDADSDCCNLRHIAHGNAFKNEGANEHSHEFLR